MMYLGKSLYVLLVLFMGTCTSLSAEERSISVKPQPDTRFEIIYEVHVPNGLDKHSKTRGYGKFAYVTVFVTEEVVKKIGSHPIVTAVAAFRNSKTWNQARIRVAKTETGLHDIERQFVSRSSVDYSIAKRAIRKGIKEYLEWKHKQKKL